MKIEQPDRVFLSSIAAAFGLSGGFATEGSTTEARTAAIFGAALPAIVKTVTWLLHKYDGYKRLHASYKSIINAILLSVGLISIIPKTSSEVQTGLLTTSVVVAITAIFEAGLHKSFENLRQRSPIITLIPSCCAGALTAFLTTFASSSKLNPYHPVGTLGGGFAMAGLAYSVLDDDGNVVNPLKRLSCPCLPKKDQGDDYQQI